MGRLLDTVPGGFYSSNFRREHASEGHRIPGARRRSLNVHAESTPLVRLQSLTKTYREGERRQTVLRDVDLTLEAGAFVALFGRSGSGKSTLLNLISGIDLPTSGEVILGDVNLTALSERERTLFRRRNLGFVFQSFNLIPTLTVEENVMLPLELCGRGGGRAKAAAMLTEVGLGDRSRSFPDRLSGGEQQRVAIARALIHNPLLVLADEPTGNLDDKTGRQVMELLHRIVRKNGATMLVVTHDDDFLPLTNRVLRLKAGVLTDRSNLAAERPVA